MTPLAIKALRTLQPGDEYVVHWAKDDDPADQRCDYETQTVLKWRGLVLLADTDCVDEWDTGAAPDLDDNLIDTSRGYAYFYEAAS